MASPHYCSIISVCIISTCVHICSWQTIDTLRLYNVVRSIRSPVSLLADLLHRHKASYFIHPFIYSTNIYPVPSTPRHYARYWIDCLGQTHQHGANRPVWANSGVLFEYISNCALWEALGEKGTNVDQVSGEESLRECEWASADWDTWGRASQRCREIRPNWRIWLSPNGKHWGLY